MSKHTPGSWKGDIDVKFSMIELILAAGGIKISIGNSIRCFNKSTFIEVK